MDICLILYNYSNGPFYTHFFPFGIIFNILSVIGLIASTDFKTSNLFRYLLIKAIADTLYLSCVFITALQGTCINCFHMKSYDICYYSANALDYTGLTSAFISVNCEVASNFNRYRTIAGKFHFMNRISFWFKICVMVLAGLAYYVYRLKSFECLTYTMPDNKTQEFYISYSYFSYSNTFHYLQLGSRTYRDVICSLILIPFNILMAIFMNRHLSKKALLRGMPNMRASFSMRIRKDNKAKIRVTVMVMLTSLLTLIGHIPTFISTFFDAGCFQAFGDFLFGVPYSLTFFVYIIYLKDFARFYKNIVLKLVSFSTFNMFKFQRDELDSSASVANLSMRLSNFNLTKNANIEN